MNSKVDYLLVNNSLFPQCESISTDQQSTSRTQKELETMRDLLNSQRIQYVFGEYAVDLLLQDDQIRVSNLSAKNIMRTCAVVNFSDTIPNWLHETHKEIVNGASIGQTIKDEKFELTKHNIYFGVCNLPAFAKEMMGTDEETASIHIYQLHVTNPETTESCLYCTITEIHSPLYLTLGDLKVRYPTDIEEHLDINDSIQGRLNALVELDNRISHTAIYTI